MASPTHPVRIGIIGEPRRGYKKHETTNDALRHSAESLSIPIHLEWIATARIAHSGVCPLLEEFDALVAPPQSPVGDINGAMMAIGYARRHKIPFLATCGGFQNTLLEYAKDVLGIRDACHEEYDDANGVPVIARVTCSLKPPTGNGYALSGIHKMRIRAATIASRVYGRAVVEEELSCNYALNPGIQSECERTGLCVSGVAEDGTARIVELAGHPFFVATLFLPQFASSAAIPHPLISEFLDIAARRARRPQAMPVVTY